VTFLKSIHEEATPNAAAENSVNFNFANSASIQNVEGEPEPQYYEEEMEENDGEEGRLGTDEIIDQNNINSGERMWN